MINNELRNSSSDALFTNINLPLQSGLDESNGSEDLVQVFYNTVKSEYFTEHNFEEALTLVSQLPKEIKYYNNLIGACTNFENSSEVIAKTRQVYERIMSDGVKPNLITFNRLIDISAKNAAFSDASEFFKQIEANNLEYDQYSICSMIFSHLNTDNKDKAIETFEKMENLGILPNAKILNTFLKALYIKSDRGDLTRLDNIKNKYSHIFDTLTRNRLLKNYAIRCSSKDVEEVYHELFSESNGWGRRESPNSMTFSILLKDRIGYRGKLRAQFVLNEMIKWRTKPDIKLCKELVTSFEVGRKDTNIERLLKHMGIHRVSMDEDFNEAIQPHINRMSRSFRNRW